MTQLRNPREALDEARRLFEQTYPLVQDEKLFITILKRAREAAYGHRDLESMRERIETLLEAYPERAVEFSRDGALYFADERMALERVSKDEIAQMLERIEEQYD